MDKREPPSAPLEKSTATLEKKLRRQKSIPVIGGAATGALAGAALGAFAGPPGAVIGAALGAAVGMGAGAASRRGDEQNEAADTALDRELGVIGGEIGAPNLAHPPSERGAFSGSSMGVGGAEEGADADEGPMPKGDA